MYPQHGCTAIAFGPLLTAMLPSSLLNPMAVAPFVLRNVKGYLLHIYNDVKWLFGGPPPQDNDILRIRLNSPVRVVC